MKTASVLSMILVMFAGTGAMADTMACVNTRTGTHTANWSQLGLPGTAVSNPFSAQASPNITMKGSFDQGPGSVAREGTDFLGDFRKSDPLLFVNNNRYLRLQFFEQGGAPLGVSQVGAQIDGPLTSTSNGVALIVAYDRNLSALGACNIIVANQGKENDTAPYLGIRDVSFDNIYYVEFMMIFSHAAVLAAPQPLAAISVPFAINRLSLTKACVQPPNTTMVAWYPFDESPLAGIGKSMDLAMANLGMWKWGINGPPVPVTGKVGNALSFNGIDQYVDALSTIVTNFGPGRTAAACSVGGNNYPNVGTYSACTGDFSIDTWIQVPSGATSDDLTILDKMNGPYGYYLAVERNQTGFVLELADGGGSTNYNSGKLVPSLQGNGWHHIAVTVSRLSSTGIRWYYDGEPLSVNDPTGRKGYLVSPNNSNPLRIGARTPTSPTRGWFHGDLDELEIYNRVLAPTEVKGIYGAGSFGKCKPQPPCIGPGC